MVRLFKAEESQKQIANIEGLVNKKHIELEKVRADFKRETAKLELSYVERQQKLIEEIIPLKSEVESLESRKKEALKPLTDQQDALNLREEALKVKEKDLSLVQSALDERERDLTIRLEGVEELSSELHNSYEEHKTKQKSCQEREKRLKKLEEEYGKEVLAFAQEKTLFNAKVVAFNNEMDAQNRILEADRAFIQKEKDEIIKIRVQLADQRATLERAMQRL